MPTVDQLDPAAAATDADELLASQAGILRRITRGQLLAGMQPQLDLPTGSLLGRASSGDGAPQTITLGAGLVMSGSALAAITPATPSLNGLDASAGLVTPDGAATARTLASLLAAAITPESFGAVGDGITDDTAAINAAIASQRPVHLGPRVYATNGQWTIPGSATLLGTPGQTVLRRIAQSSGSGAWISIQGAAFHAQGVIFDANSANVPGESWAVLVTAACLQTLFRDCAFRNAGGRTLGNGLTVLASDPAIASHVISDCEASGNAAHGIWVQAVGGARITGNRAHDNAAYGICADFNDPAFRQAIRLASITGNTCWNNLRGIALGNFNTTNLQPPTWGNANPDAIGAIVAGNVCHDNQVYGIAVSGRALLVQANLLSANGSTANGGGGILANAAYSRIAGNTITGAGQFGIDCGGSVVLDVSGNHVSGAAIGINPGGSQGVYVASNTLQDNGWAITAYNVETDGAGRNFGLATTNLALIDNMIGLSSSNGGGIWLIDAPQSVLVARNNFYGTNGATIAQCLYAHTDGAVVDGNRWNNNQRILANPVSINGVQTIQLPDIADEIVLSTASAGVQSMQTMRQLAVTGQVGFIKVASGGSGYSQAAVAIGGTGTGATAIAQISGGVVIGIALTNPGAGYGAAGAPAIITITGDGTAAAAIAMIGLPVLEGRRVRIACNTATRFARAGSAPFQENWTLADITIPANATVAFTGAFGGWRADAVPLADYIDPPGNGSLLLRSLGGADVNVHPASGGHLRVSTDADPVGYVAAVGHGAPEGVVSAPPGSDYRNLDGGAGQTLWIKRAGSDPNGWFAVA